MKRRIVFYFSTYAFFLFMLGPAQADPQDLVSEAALTVRHFSADPEMTWLQQNIGRAKAVIVMPTQVKGGFIWGASGGNGVMMARKGQGWTHPAFYSLGSLTFGLQIGGQVSEIVMLVMTERGVNALLSPRFKIGGEVSVAAGPVGIGAEVATADIIAFARNKGLYGGLNLEGAVITTRTAWNEDYYGRGTRVTDILIKDVVRNSGADRLRTELSTLAVGR